MARETLVRLGIGRETALRIASRLPCRRGSILVAARALGMEVNGSVSGVDVALAAIPVLVDEVRALRRELGELRAIVGEPGTRWVTQTEWARANGISTDTVARKVTASRRSRSERSGASRWSTRPASRWSTSTARPASDGACA